MVKEFFVCIRKKQMTENGDVEDLCLTAARTRNCDLLDITGGNGAWQRRIFFIRMFLYIPFAFHIYSMSFLAPNLDHWCARPIQAENWSVEEWRTLAMPPNDEHCSKYEHVDFINSTQVPEKSKVIPCSSWEYNTTVYRSTVVNQWDLVCDRQWFISLSKSVFSVGLLSASMVCGYLSDRFGRRPIIFVAVFSTVFSSIMCAFSTSFTMFLTFRFFVAVGCMGTFDAPYVLLVEAVNSRYRATYCILATIGWGLGDVLLPIIAWFIRDWFWIQIAITVPSILSIFIIFWLPESPRWLMNKGKVEEAERVLIKAAKLNGVDISVKDMAALKEVMAKRTQIYESGKTKGNLFSLMKIPGAWKVPANVFFNLFVNGFVYYGLSFNTNELAGDPFLNFVLLGLVQFPAYFIAAFVVHSSGRRNPLAASMIISGIACIVSFLLPQDPWWLSTSVSMIGMLFIGITFEIIDVFSCELFPTVIRTTAVATGSLVSRIGTIIAPFTRELGDVTHPLFPQIILGALAITSGLLVLFLPETRNCVIPDTIEETANFYKMKRSTSKTFKFKSFSCKSKSKGTINLQEATQLMNIETEQLPKIV